MTRAWRLRSWQKPALSKWGNEGAAQIVEFAVALPLLVVFVVGIFDFSGAFTLKQKLTNVARDAARAAATSSSSDVLQGASTTPASVITAFQVVENYFQANKLSDCGVSLTGSAVPTWTYTGTTGCPSGGLTITINRGYYFPASTAATAASVNCAPQNPGAATAVVATCVSIQYAYAWRFGRAASLLGSNTTLPPTISAVGVAMNEN